MIEKLRQKLRALKESKMYDSREIRAKALLALEKHQAKIGYAKEITMNPIIRYYDQSQKPALRVSIKGVMATHIRVVDSTRGERHIRPQDLPITRLLDVLEQLESEH